MSAQEDATTEAVREVLGPGAEEYLGERNGKGASQTAPHPTDLGNAERLVARHGDDLRYVHPWRKWLVWDGKRWRHDDAGEVARRAKSTVKDMYREAAENDGRIDKDLAKHAMRSEAKERIAAMIALAETEPGIPVRPEQLDSNPWLLNVENGTLDLRTGELRDHSRKDLLTKLAPVEYHSDAEAPTWEATLAQWLPSEALRRFVQRLIGYCLTGDVSEQVLPFLHGPGANGKTTLINTALAMMGDYGQQAAPDLLLAKHGAHPTELADLFGARLVVSVEVEDGRRLAESLVKQLTGGDKIKARRMREDFWQWDPTHKVLLVANHRPVVRGTDHAIWRRIKLVPFDVTIPKEEQDPRLPEKLRAELPGILAWAMRGCLDWQRDGLGEPEEVKSATEGYRSEMDVLTGFVQERCVIRSDAWVKFSDLYTSYQGWCTESGETAVSKRSFGTRLKERGFEPDRGTGNVPIRRGIGLRDDQHPDPEGGPKVTEGDDSYPNAESADRDRYAQSGETNYSGYPELDMNGPDNLHEGSYRVEGNYGNYGNSTHTNNDMPAEANRAAEGLAKEGGNSNTSSNHPSLAAGSSALGESGGEHVVGASGGRLTAEEAEEVKRLVARGELSYGEARAAVLAEREPRRRGFSDCSHQKGAHE